MIEGFIQEWWPQITGLIVLIAYLNRQQTRMEVRIENLEAKVTDLFRLWNDHVNRLLTEKNKKD